MKFTVILSFLLVNNIHATQRIKRTWYDMPPWSQPKSKLTEQFDFIIVGSGSAGSVIANRLSEVPHWKILLLEAGEKGDLLTEIPMVVSLVQFTKYNWKYRMEYQPGIAGACTDNLMPWPRGKGLGGSTLLNYMIYTRGNRFCYDKLASKGNPGWSYKDVLPYFLKSENAGLKFADYNFHGLKGYMSVEGVYQSKISNGFIQGLQELGVPYIDYNSNRTLGVSTVQGTVFKGHRVSVDKAFLEPVKHRPNLHILTSAFVTKILIDRETSEAYGVEYERFGQKYKVEATKEIILSAGTFMSAQLLMLSGIGPKEHLQDLGIPILKNLPVGEFLEDHLAFWGLVFSSDQNVAMHFSDIFNPFSFYNFFSKGTGPLTSLGGVQAIAYLKTSLSEEREYIPDLELLFAGASPATDYGLFLRKSLAIRDDVYGAFYAPLETKSSFIIIPTLLTPKSRGYLRLQSKNPHSYPLLYGNFFTDRGHKDINTLLTGVRIVQRLAKTKAFARFGATLNTNRLPGCTHHKYDSDDYWRCCLKSLSQTLHHQIGTVKMGPEDDPEAVVNHELKVYGISKLRVADCSVIPHSLGAHTSAPAIMIGEKASDLIKETWL